MAAFEVITEGYTDEMFGPDSVKEQMPQVGAIQVSCLAGMLVDRVGQC